MQNFAIILAGLSVGLAAFALLCAYSDLRAFLIERDRIAKRLAEIERSGGNVRWRIIQNGKGN
jgi:uncharacterized membrane protein